MANFAAYRTITVQHYDLPAQALWPAAQSRSNLVAAPVTAVSPCGTVADWLVG